MASKQDVINQYHFLTWPLMDLHISQIMLDWQIILNALQCGIRWKEKVKNAVRIMHGAL